MLLPFSINCTGRLCSLPQGMSSNDVLGENVVRTYGHTVLAVDFSLGDVSVVQSGTHSVTCCFIIVLVGPVKVPLQGFSKVPQNPYLVFILGNLVLLFYHHSALSCMQILFSIDQTHLQSRADDEQVIRFKFGLKLPFLKHQASEPVSHLAAKYLFPEYSSIYKICVRIFFYLLCT